MEKLSKEQLMVLVFVAGTTALADLEGPIEQLAEGYFLADSKDEKKQYADKFKELTSAYNTEAKSTVYHTDVKKVKMVSVATDSKNPTPGEAKTYRKPKDLNETERLEILARIDKGDKRAEIAAAYNVHPSTISDIVTARNKANAPAATEAGATAPAAEQPAAQG